ncbi:MAG: sigma-54-dependent Fis family transcriptional regulator [Nitrospirae bacterium]|nr:MAG: sigma-54-dependent Fis family transcriptional regulator [Nitrospirota bacterium]
MGERNEPVILIVEDDAHMRAALSKSLGIHGYPVMVAHDGHEALECLEKQKAWLVIADLNMPGKSGLEMLRDMRSAGITVPVVVMTAYGSVESAVEALKLGAVDYLQKPFPFEQLEEMIARVRANVSGQDATHPADSSSVGFLTCSERVRQILKMVEAVAPSQATILIQGESGTGKEVLARYIHSLSPRARGPFVAVNCAALPDGLLESELFGYEKGAFTGALARRCGKFELAHQGTLLLDEIGEMSLGLQAKLLRVLQEREVDRLGARHPIPVDIRVLATTNRNLQQEVQAGRFREDLFYRLSVLPVTLPPLRERPEDIPLLAHYFAEQSFRRNRKPGAGITPEAMACLKSRSWRGNARELENAIERAVLLADTGPLRIEHFAFETEGPVSEGPLGNPNQEVTGPIWAMERDLILRALERHGGNRTHAARELGISIRTMRNKLREYRRLGLDV